MVGGFVACCALAARPRGGRAAEECDELAAFQCQCLPCFQPEDITAGDLLHCGISAPSNSDQIGA